MHAPPKGGFSQGKIQKPPFDKFRVGLGPPTKIQGGGGQAWIQGGVKGGDHPPQNFLKTKLRKAF